MKVLIGNEGSLIVGKEMFLASDSHMNTFATVFENNAALIINNYVHAVFDFESKKGYCRTGFPPPAKGWSENGHEWNECAIELFN